MIVCLVLNFELKVSRRVTEIERVVEVRCGDIILVFRVSIRQHFIIKKGNNNDEMDSKIC